MFQSLVGFCSLIVYAITKIENSVEIALFLGIIRIIINEDINNLLNLVLIV